MPLLQNRIHFWLAGALGYGLLRGARATWQVRFIDRADCGPRIAKGQHQIMVAFWHRYLACTMCGYRGLPFCVPVSEHRDGEFIAQVMERHGFLAVRGSTTRGASRLLHGLLDAISEGWSCAITPDGPRGPRHSVQPGFILLARRSGLPLHPLGIAVDRAWVMNSWDAFVVPKPWAQIVIVVDTPLLPAQFGGRSADALSAELKARIFQADERARQALQEWPRGERPVIYDWNPGRRRKGLRP